MAIKKKSPASKFKFSAKKKGGKGKASAKKVPLKKVVKRAPGPAKSNKARGKGLTEGKKGGLAANPEGLALSKQIAAVLDDRKASDVVIFDIRGKASYADYIVVASAESDRQVNALAEAVDEKLRPLGHRPISTEGEDTGNWVLLDYSDVIVHLFLTDERSHRDLDGLWADAPRVK